MPWNSETQQFDPPPILEEIWAESDPIEQSYQLFDLVEYKFRQGLPLSDAERAYGDAYLLYGLIMGDGWDGLFECCAPESWPRVFTVLSFLGYSTLEGIFREALHLRNPRPIPAEDLDDPTVAQLEAAQPTTEERDRFYALRLVAEPELQRLVQDLPKFAKAHRNDFVDFPRSLTSEESSPPGDRTSSL